MIKVGNTTHFENHEQKLFREILETKGSVDKVIPLLKDLIAQNLDKEAAIIAWMKRNHFYNIYAKIKNEQAVVNESMNNPEMQAIQDGK